MQNKKKKKKRNKRQQNRKKTETWTGKKKWRACYKKYFF